MFRGRHQQDSHELLRFLLGLISTEIEVHQQKQKKFLEKLSSQDIEDVSHKNESDTTMENDVKEVDEDFDKQNVESAVEGGLVLTSLEPLKSDQENPDLNSSLVESLSDFDSEHTNEEPGYFVPPFQSFIEEVILIFFPLALGNYRFFFFSLLVSPI